MRTLVMVVCSLVLALGLGGILAIAQGTPPATGQTPGQTQPAQPMKGGVGAKAFATIESRSGSKVTGRADFMQQGGKVRLTISIENATPGPHAVHLHEKGDCSDPEAKSAGGHWNPTTEDHGKWGQAPFHHGDIGNIEVGADGKGKVTLETDLWSIGGDPGTDVIGKAIVVHASPDDFKSQPAGNAGGRVGCGVVQAGK